jgi:leader peptidase (prepilin peptidase)/N-methyltransferase
MAAAIVDVAEQRLPNVLTVGAGLVGFVGLGAVTVATGDGSVWRAAAGAGILGGWVLLGALVVHDGYGLGDVKLAAALGVLLAWQSWMTLVVGVLVSQVAVTAALITARMRRRHQVALGPAFVTGAGVALAAATLV